MKRSKQRNKPESSQIEEEKVKEVNVSRRTREKYYKEIVENKEAKKEKTTENESGVKNEDNTEKFSELKKYLLSDLSGNKTLAKEDNNSGRREVGLKKNKKTPKKKTMIDTREDQDAVKTAKSTKNSPSEKSPSKKNSVVNSDTNDESQNVTNVKEKSPKKQTLSPDKMLAVTQESPRTGSRQRSPNLRYADDMVIFPLKPLTKRQIFKKDSNTTENSGSNVAHPKTSQTMTENSGSNDKHPKTSQTIECQTSQLYSLLTKNVISVQKKESDKISDDNENTEIDEENGKIDNKRSCDQSGDKTIKTEPVESSLTVIEEANKKSCDQSCDKTEMVKTEPVDSSLTVKEELNGIDGESLEKVDSVKTKSVACGKDKTKEGGLGFLHSLTNVIDQIIVESTQEEMPEWAVYKQKPPKIKRAKRRKPLGQKSEFKVKTDLHELQTDGDVSYSVLDSTPGSSGDEDDVKGRRRMTKPISKSSIIRMSPALGLLVGHDEDGFRTLNQKKKRARSKNKQLVDKNIDENKKLSSTKLENVDDSVLVKKEPEEQKTVDNETPVTTVTTSSNSALVVSSNTTISTTTLTQSQIKTVLSPPTQSQIKNVVSALTQSQIKTVVSTAPQSQMKVLGNAGLIGTKATIVSGSQTLPCVLVSTSSNLKPQSLLNLPRPGNTSQNSLIIPANRISLIGTKSTQVTVVSPPVSVMSPMVSANATRNIRPNTLQMLGPIGQSVSVLKTPLKPGQLPANTYFRLSSDGQLISTQRPLVSVKTPTTSQMGGTVTTSGVVSTGTTNSAFNLPLKSKVLILKKSDVPCSSGQILVSSPSAAGMRQGMSLLKKFPITSIGNQPISVVAIPKSVATDNSKHEDVKKTVAMENNKNDGGKSLVAMENNKSDDGKSLVATENNKNDDDKKSVAMDTSKNDDEKNPVVMETSNSDDGETAIAMEIIQNDNIEKKKPQHLLPLNNLIDKIKTNMNSLMELPDCLATGRFMDSVMINEEYDSDSESEKETLEEKNEETDLKINEQNDANMTTVENLLKDDDLLVSTKSYSQTEADKQVNNIMETQKSDVESNEESPKNGNEKTKETGPKDSISDEKSFDEVTVHRTEWKDDISTDSNHEKVSSNLGTKSESSLDEKSEKLEILSNSQETKSESDNDKKLEKSEKLSNNQESKSSHDEKLEKCEPVKEQSISLSLEDKLKKAMESLSNVKSVLAAKTSKIVKTESLQAKEKTPVLEDLSKQMEREVQKTDTENEDKLTKETVACGSSSESEDHGESRRNIFDVIMTDYQSPNKDGKSSDSDGEKLVIEIKDSPTKKSDRGLFDIGLTTKDSPTKKDDRGLFDIGLTTKDSPTKKDDRGLFDIGITTKDSPTKKDDRGLFDIGLTTKSTTDFSQPTIETDKLTPETNKPTVEVNKPTETEIQQKNSVVTMQQETSVTKQQQTSVVTKQQDKMSQDADGLSEKHDGISIKNEGKSENEKSTEINDEMDQIDNEKLDNEEGVSTMDIDDKNADIEDEVLQTDDGLQTVQSSEVVSNKSEIQEELSDSNDCLIIEQDKTKDVVTDISPPKVLTMADKLLAKFKEWEQGGSTKVSVEKSKPETSGTESSKSPAKVDSGHKTPIMRSPAKINRIGNRSPFSKPPIKLKICSSPDKSYIVAKPDNSNEEPAAGRPVPKTSTQQEIKNPLPMNILTRPEQEVKDKMSAFSSQVLDNFLERQTITIEDEEEEDDEDDDDDDEDDDDDDDDDDNDDENINENDYDSDVSMNEQEPDFDEIDGILFMSFPSKNALKAHVQVERRTKLGTDEHLLLGMTRMRNMRRKQGYILSKYNRRIGNKFFKDQDNISQNLRGMHKTLAKYQRLYKQELHWLENPEDDSKMHKTNDITKIKGWKNKVGNVTDDVEYAKAEIENGGKLHWRTEARLAKNLRPDELKEFGLNIKKKRRKNIIYTQRKGMSKGDRSHRTENGQDEFEDSRSNSNEVPVEFINEEVESRDHQEEEHENEPVEREDVTIIFDPDDNVQDEELVNINEREIMKDDERRKNTERHRMFIKAQMLKKRLGYDLRDVQVIRKLGGHNIRRRKNAEGIYTGDYMVMPDSNTSRPSTPEVSQTEEADTPHKKNRRPRNEITMTILSSNMVLAACSTLPKEYIRKKPPRPDMKETNVESPEPGQSSTCDKPGCRYGCICHLCVFTEQSPEAAARVVKCEKEYCRLGCICDSIEARKDKNSHCGKTECMVQCICDEGEKRSKKDNDKDYHYSGQKKNAKFAALPRRESTYRLAKNLDAVSRKAMLLYETSEMFVDQKVRRRRSKESTTDPPPQVYMDIDIDDYDLDQQVTSVSSKSRKQEFSKTTLHKPIPIRPKSSQQKKKAGEMTDFSNIKSEISSQGSWNLSDLSDEYEDVEAGSDKDSELSSCARTNVYRAIKRHKHLSGCTCSQKPYNVDGLGCDVDARFNIPDDILSSGKWHTQWICLRSKGQTEDKGGLRLLEVISNCNYEEEKGKILSRLTSHISKDSYPKIKSFIVGDFQVTFLPKSDKPAVIPPEVKAKLPDFVYSIRIRIIKDPRGGVPQVINLVNDKDEIEMTTVIESKKEKHQQKMQPKRIGQSEQAKRIGQSEQAKRIGQSEAKRIGQSELARHLTSNITLPANSSSAPAVAPPPGGISGFSRLNITRPTVPVNMSSNGQATPPSASQQPFITTNVGGVGCAITLSQPINVMASTGTAVSTSVTSTNIPGNSPSLIQTSQPNSSSSYAILGTYSNLQAARNQLSNIVKNQMMKPLMSIVPNKSLLPNSSQLAPRMAIVANNSQLESQNILKRKLPEQTVGILDSKKSKVEGDSVSNTVPSVGPSSVSSVGPSSVPPVGPLSEADSIGQISVLRCVKCHVILTAEDITSWVLSPHENVQQKICVKCRNVNTQKYIPAVKTSTPKSSSPIVIDTDEQMESENISIVKETDSKITQQVDNSLLQMDCENIDSLGNSNENSSESSKTKPDDLLSKGVIDLSSGDESKDDKQINKDNKVSKVVSATPSDDELEAAIRDAQDDYDNMARNLSDENESQEDVQKIQSPMKSNVIVIDDDEDNGEAVKPRSGKKRRSIDEEEDVDVISFTESDMLEMSSLSHPTSTVVPHWHSSSCSIHSNLIKKKRKSQLDLIENKQINEVEIKESSIKFDSEEYRRWKINRERKRRHEMHHLYKDISSLVMTEEEMKALTKLSQSKTEILDKVLEYIKMESTRTHKLEGKVKAFRHYQYKLKQQLEELKKFHIERGISKEKLDFQLDKIAVVCDKIYEHLPEIKKHIRNKKDGSDTTSTTKSKNQPKQAKKTKPATSKKRISAEIYIDNPEKYGENMLNQSSTPLGSLPGSYVKMVPTLVQGPIVGQQPVLGLPVQGTSVIGPVHSVIGLPVAGLQNPNIRLQTTPVVSNVGLSGPPFRFPITNTTMTLHGIQTPTSSTNTPKQTIETNQTSSSQNAASYSGVQSSPEISKILNSPSGVQNLGQHPSTSAFSEVIGQIIKKNIVEDNTLENAQSKAESQASDKQTDNSLPSLPQYDVNLLKDQILDDATGELISVVINNEDGENEDNDKSIESPNTSDNNKSSSENKDMCENVENDDTNIESLLNDIKSLSGGVQEDESPKQQSDLVKKPEQTVLPNLSLLSEDKTDQVDGDIFTANKDSGDLSDSNNSAQTNPYMEDSDGNNSIAGDISDGGSPKIVSVMSIADVLGDNFKSAEGSPDIGPQGDNDSMLMSCIDANVNVSENL